MVAVGAACIISGLVLLCAGFGLTIFPFWEMMVVVDMAMVGVVMGYAWWLIKNPLKLPEQGQ